MYNEFRSLAFGDYLYDAPATGSTGWFVLWCFFCDEAVWRYCSGPWPERIHAWWPDGSTLRSTCQSGFPTQRSRKRSTVCSMLAWEPSWKSDFLFCWLFFLPYFLFSSLPFYSHHLLSPSCAILWLCIMFESPFFCIYLLSSGQDTIVAVQQIAIWWALHVSTASCFFYFVSCSVMGGF